MEYLPMPETLKINFTKYLHTAITRLDLGMIILYIQNGASLTTPIDYEGKEKTAFQVFQEIFAITESRPCRFRVAAALIEEARTKNIVHPFNCTKLLHGAIKIGSLDMVNKFIDLGASLTEKISHINHKTGKKEKIVAIEVLDRFFDPERRDTNKLAIAQALIVAAFQQKEPESTDDDAKIGLMLLNLIQVRAYGIAKLCIKPNVSMSWHTDSKKDYVWTYLIKYAEHDLLEQVITIHLENLITNSLKYNTLDELSDQQERFLDKLMACADSYQNMEAIKIIVRLAGQYTKEANVIERCTSTDSEPCSSSESPASSVATPPVSPVSMFAPKPICSSRVEILSEVPSPERV